MEQLVKRAMKHDADAFLENDADVADAMQDTIVTCYEKIDTLRQPQYFKTWLMRVLMNQCYQILRHYDHFDRSGEMTQIPVHDDGMQRTRFDELLSLVDERYHLILTLFYADELSISEIASLLDMNENTVKTRLKRAREQARRSLNEENKFSYGY